MPEPMTPERYVTILDELGWSPTTLARKLDMPDDRQPRRWRLKGSIPPPVAEWLERLAGLVRQAPPPARPDGMEE